MAFKNHPWPRKMVAEMKTAVVGLLPQSGAWVSVEWIAHDSKKIIADTICNDYFARLKRGSDIRLSREVTETERVLIGRKILLTHLLKKCDGVEWNGKSYLYAQFRQIANTGFPRIDGLGDPELTLVPVDEIVADRVRLQMRAGMDAGRIEDMEQAYRTGHSLPELVVVLEGKTHWLCDGFHRLEGAKRAGWDKVPCLVRHGEFQHARQLAFASNKEHNRVGYPRSQEDRRRAVEECLRDLGETWSDNRVAEWVGVDHKTVADIRASMERLGIPNLSTPQKRHGADGGKYPSRRLTPEEEKEVCRRYDEFRATGMTDRKACEEVGVTHPTIKRMKERIALRESAAQAEEVKGRIRAILAQILALSPDEQAEVRAAICPDCTK